MDKGTPIILYEQPQSKINCTMRHQAIDVKLHTHNFYELEYIHNGSGTNIINGVSFPLKTGLFYLLTPNDMHQINIGGVTDMTHIGFLPEAQSDLARILPSGAVVTQLSEDEQRTIHDYLDIIDRDSDSSQPYALQNAFAALNLAVIYLLRRGRSYAMNSSFYQLQPALTYIWQHCTDESLNLEEVAHACGLTPCYFSTRFHESFGQSFTSYLNECRLRCACYLLRETDRSITDVAYASGYSSAAHFFRTFRRFYHTTPKEYRQKRADESLDYLDPIPSSVWKNSGGEIHSLIDAGKREISQQRGEP